MEQITDIQELVLAYHLLLQNTSTSFHRYLYNDIDWEERLVGVKGPKGVGKTTMLLQHIKEVFHNPDEALYVSLDNLWFTNHSLKDLVQYYYVHGGRHLFLDEVHYYPHWQTLLKNFYDTYPDLHVVYTGSSMLQLSGAEGDLSRRLLDYTMTGLSFREFLEYEGVSTVEKLSLEELLKNHVRIAYDIKARISSIQPLFEQYLHYGYYPFYKDVRTSFENRLRHVVNHVLDVDYPMVDDVTVSTIRKAKKMLMILAESVQQIPTMNTLYSQLETDRIQGLKILYALERAGLLQLLTDDAKSLKVLSRPEKIFLNNPNLMYALGDKTNIGTIRETFFFNQVAQVCNVSYPANGDFLVDKKYLFEVGGAGKSFEQIKDIENSFLAVDNTEIGYRNRIPLWMFGLLY
ncbi:MAG: ATP-binding protein [Bacteroidales bacterium]|nr:ATP-binding protein [Bacteroidales bacterium]